MSERFYENTPFYSSLKEYFKNDSRYSSIEYIAQNKPLIIKDKKKAKELFGKDMYISPQELKIFITARSDIFANSVFRLRKEQRLRLIRCNVALLYTSF